MSPLIIAAIITAALASPAMAQTASIADTTTGNPAIDLCPQGKCFSSDWKSSGGFIVPNIFSNSQVIASGTTTVGCIPPAIFYQSECLRVVKVDRDVLIATPSASHHYTHEDLDRMRRAERRIFEYNTAFLVDNEAHIIEEHVRTDIIADITPDDLETEVEGLAK